MATIVEEVLVVKFSRIVKGGCAESTTVISPEIQAALEQVAQELVGAGTIVEVERA